MGVTSNNEIRGIILELWINFAPNESMERVQFRKIGTVTI